MYAHQQEMINYDIRQNASKSSHHTYESDVTLLIKFIEESVSQHSKIDNAITRLKYAIKNNLDDYGMPK